MWLTMSLKEKVLYETVKWSKERGLELLAVILFGSSVYGPSKARDVDVIIVVRSLKNILEKVTWEVQTSRRLRRALGKPVDVLIFDVESFLENLQPGTVLSGLVQGYEILLDKIDLKSKINGMFVKLAEEDYMYYKGSWKDLAWLARMRLKKKDKCG